MCSTGADPTTDSMTLGLVAKVGSQGRRSRHVRIKMENMIKCQSFIWFKIYYSCLMSLPGTSKVQIKNIIK